MSKLPEVVE